MAWQLERFQHELHKLDPMLRCRLAYERSHYIIERKCERGSACGTKPDMARGYDRWIGDRDGYVYVMAVMPQMLSYLVLEHLRNTDMWTQGGAEKVANELDAQDMQRDVDIDRQQSSYLIDRGKEIYDKHMWHQGDVVAGFHTSVGGIEFANPKREGGQ